MRPFLLLLRSIVPKLVHGLNAIYNRCVLIMNGVSIVGIARISGRIYILNRGFFHLGESVKINSSPHSNPIGGDARTNIIITAGAHLRIGNNVGISNSTIYCTKEITIEDNVMIGGSCKIYDSDFHSIDYEERIAGSPMCGRGAVRIKEGAWLCTNVIVLKGVTIGGRSVIGAGSVVTCDVPTGEIWAGNPARFVRKI